jgi:hypothetical protein
MDENTETILMWGGIAIAAYFAYQVWMNSQTSQSSAVAPTSGTVSTSSNVPSTTTVTPSQTQQQSQHWQGGGMHHRRWR